MRTRGSGVGSWRLSSSDTGALSSGCFGFSIRKVAWILLWKVTLNIWGREGCILSCLIKLYPVEDDLFVYSTFRFLKRGIQYNGNNCNG